MYNRMNTPLTNERVKVGGIYWHPGYARLVRVLSLGMRFEGIGAEFEFVDSPNEEPRWCFAEVLRSHRQIKADTLKLLTEFQANQAARVAFAQLEG